MIVTSPNQLLMYARFMVGFCESGKFRPELVVYGAVVSVLIVVFQLYIQRSHISQGMVNAKRLQGSGSLS